MDIREKIRKTDSNDSHLYKHDLQPALKQTNFLSQLQIFNINESLQLSESMRLVRNILKSHCSNIGLTEYWIDCLIMLQ